MNELTVGNITNYQLVVKCVTVIKSWWNWSGWSGWSSEYFKTFSKQVDILIRI